MERNDRSRSAKCAHVSLEDINTESSGDDSSLAEALSTSDKPLATPKNVEKYLSGDNAKILEGWLHGLSEREQKQDFLDNLSEVISAAEEKQLEVVNAINNYKTIKLARLSKSQLESYAETGQRVGLYSAIFGLILFVALMSLVLVMLAIERNTRA